MCVIIQAKKAKRGDLAKILEKLRSNFNYLIVSDWRDIHFVKFNPKHPTIPESDRGRAFGEKSELRWRRSEDENYFLCRWISDDGASPGAGWETLPKEELKKLKPEKVHQYLLWGEPLWKVDGSGWQAEDGEKIWYQTRIPKKLKYPINSNLTDQWTNSDDKTPLVLHVKEYKRNGQTMFERFIGLERYNSSDQKKKKEGENHERESEATPERWQTGRNPI